MDDFQRALHSLKSVILKAKVEKKGDACKELDRTIQILNSKTSTLKGFRIKDESDWSSLKCLMEFLHLREIPSEILRGSFILFQNMISLDEDFAMYLYYSCDVMRTIVKNLVGPSTSLYDTICFLKKLSKFVVINRMTPDIEEIVRYLLSKIKSGSEEDLLLLCLECLANLSKGNLALQSLIKSKASMKEINSKLIKLLSCESPHAILVSLRVLASFSLNSSLGDAIFSPQNTEQTFGIIFNVFHKQSDDLVAVVVASELLIDVLKADKICKAFLTYKHLKPCIQSTLLLLVRSQGEVTSHLARLFQTLLSVEELNPLIVNYFFTHLSQIQLCDKTVPSPPGPPCQSTRDQFTIIALIGIIKEAMNNSQISVVTEVLYLIRDLLQGAIVGALVHSTLLFTEVLLPVLVTQLCQLLPSKGQGSQLKWSLETLDVSMEILMIFCGIDAAAGEVCTSISNKIVWDIWIQLQVVPDLPWWCKTLTMQSRDIIFSNQRSYAALVVSISIKMLTLLVKLHNKSAELRELLHQLIQEAGILECISRGLLSEDSACVHRSLCLIQYTNTMPDPVTQRLCDGVMAVTLTKSQEMQERLKSCSQPTDIPENTPNREISEGEFPQKSPTHHSSSVMNSTTATNQNGIKVDSDSVNKLIDKMKSGFTIKDIKASEIMMVYECKLQNMATKENHLQELLEAKANALFHADRLNAQYRGKMAHTESDCVKLRNLLQDSEKRNEQAREEVNNLESTLQSTQQNRSLLTNQVTHLSEELERMKEVVSDYEALKYDFEQLKVRLEEAQGLQMSTDKKLHVSQERVAELEKQNTIHLKEQKELKGKLKAAELEKSHLSEHIALQTRQFNEMKEGIVIFESKVKEMELVNESAVKRNEGLMKQLEEFQCERSRLSQERDAFEEDCSRLQLCVEEQKKEIAQTRQENGMLNQKFRHIQSVLGEGILK